MTPALAFIVPVYNVEPWLDECVASLVAAAQPGDEIVLVDNGSRDRSGAMCDDWQRRHPALVQVLHGENEGVSVARNRGVMASHAPWLLFIDSDDRVAPEVVAQARTLLDRLQPDLLVADFVWWHPDQPERTRPTKPLSHPPERLLTDTDAFTVQTLEDFLPSACNRIWRRELLATLGAGPQAPFPPGATYEDMAIVPRLTARARSLVYLPQALYHYRMRPGSTTHSPMTAQRCRDHARALTGLVQDLAAAGRDHRLQLTAHMRLANQTIDAVRECGLMAVQQPALYRQVLAEGLAAFSLPMAEVAQGLEASPLPELRKTAGHLRLAHRAPALWVTLRRLGYAWRRRHLRRRRARGAV